MYSLERWNVKPLVVRRKEYIYVHFVNSILFIQRLYRCSESVDEIFAYERTSTHSDTINERLVY